MRGSRGTHENRIGLQRNDELVKLGGVGCLRGLRKGVLDGFKLLFSQSTESSSDAESLGIGDFHSNTKSIGKRALICLCCFRSAVFEAVLDDLLLSTTAFEGEEEIN